MSREINPQARIEVYTDGQCSLCRWSRAQVEPWDRDGRIEWFDYNNPSNQQRAAPLTLQELAAEMHVRKADGTWSKGYLGWLDVITALPRWRWLAGVLLKWPFSRLGPIFYRWLARRRYQLFGVPPPCSTDGVCTIHQTKQ